MGEQQQIIELLKDIKKKVVEEDEHNQERMAKLNEHFDSAIHEEMVEAAALYKSLKKTDGIAISSLPMVIQQPLKAFDADGDNTISPEELQRGAELYKASKDKNKVLARVAILLGLLCVILVGAVAGVTFSLLEATKESHTGGDGAMTPATGDAMAVATGGASATDVLDSANSDASFKSMNEVTVGGYDGKTITMKVKGFYRQPCVSCASGTVVSLLTDFGSVDVVDRTIAFYPSDDMLEIDSELENFHTWRKGPNAEPVSASLPVGRAPGQRRHLLSSAADSQVAAETAVLDSASYGTLAAADITSGKFYDVAPCGNNWMSCFKDTYKTISGNSLSGNMITYQPIEERKYADSYRVNVPDHLDFMVYKSSMTSTEVGFIIAPNENGDGALTIPNYSWSGAVAGQMKLEGKAVISGSVDGKVELKADGKVQDSFVAKYSSASGLQVGFMHEITAANLGDDFNGIMAKFDGTAEASIFVEVGFSIPTQSADYRGRMRKGNTFQGIHSFFRVTLGTAVGGLSMVNTVFVSDGDFKYAEKYRSYEGAYASDQAVAMSFMGENVEAGKRKLLASGSLTSILKASLEKQLTKMTELSSAAAPIHENLSEVAESAAYMQETQYFRFAEAINERNGYIALAQGDAGEEAMDLGSQVPNDFMPSGKGFVESEVFTSYSAPKAASGAKGSTKAAKASGGKKKKSKKSKKK